MSSTVTPSQSHPVAETDETTQWKGPLAGTDHTVLRVPDLDAAIDWYKKLLGIVPIERGNGRVFLASPVTGRVVLGLSDGTMGLDYVSFRARSHASFEAIATKLDQHGVTTKLGTKLTRPGALDALRIDLPSGHRFEVIHPTTDAPAAPIDGEYRPGALDVRTSHLQLRTNDVKSLTDFLGIVGFRSSAFVPLPESEGYFIQFLRTNELHHQIAILTGQNGMHHVALEIDQIDFWRFLDNLALTKLAAEYGPVRHHEGNMLSIYVRDPWKNRIEITSSMAVVGFDYPAKVCSHEPWYHMNMWGPQPPQTWETEWA